MNCRVINLSTKGTDGHIATLSVYAPQVRGNVSKKSVLILPGGAYACTSEREGEPVALEFAARGYNAFVLWYSVAPNCYPTQLLQVHEALQFILKEFPNEDLYLCGFSAGGHLAGSYLTTTEVQPVALKGGILGYPVVSSSKRAGHTGSFENLLGKDFNQLKEKLSLEKRVGNDTPPIFLWHTYEDACVPVKHALLLADALEEHKIPFELHIYTEGEHGLSVADKRVCETKTRHHHWMKDVINWMERT